MVMYDGKAKLTRVDGVRKKISAFSDNSDFSVLCMKRKWFSFFSASTLIGNIIERRKKNKIKPNGFHSYEAI